MSTENFDAKWAELLKTMADLKEQTKECRQELEKAQALSDEALATKLTSIKASNDIAKDQMKMLDGEEKKVEATYRSMARFTFVNASVGAHRDSERMEFGAKITDLGAEIEINNMLIKSLEDSRRRDGEKSGGSEAK
ncbi:hypothetical protein V2G26_004038 [Clonostachys chloroleuca]|uniref:Uncharacterized protein n=1 Tax=Clonostachys chloroleuca TaxID=1926264 RepID=A0AA35M2V8_9HYPO|nr:unnamed protein product [Clonostachys chloroleuca]